jgi:hypothetical protein
MQANGVAAIQCLYLPIPKPMSHFRKILYVISGLAGILAISWLARQGAMKKSELPRESAKSSTREPGGNFRADRLAAAAQQSSTATNGNSQSSDSAIEMARAAGVPATVGKSGLWAGVMPSDAASGGRKAFAVARAGASRADLRPDQNGMFQRMHSATSQRIEFQLSYPGMKSTEWVDVGILDGGTVEPTGSLKPDKNGNISFVFHTGASDGSYRISLTTSDHDTKMLDIWAGRPEWEERLTAN